jgi:hypothetical protein
MLFYDRVGKSDPKLLNKFQLTLLQLAKEQVKLIYCHLPWKDT